MLNKMDLLEIAWGVIANASDWDIMKGEDVARPEWVNAATRWRDDYHKVLEEHLKKTIPASEVVIT